MKTRSAREKEKTESGKNVFNLQRIGHDPRMKHRLRPGAAWLTSGICWSVKVVFAVSSLGAQTQADPSKWEAEIQAFEAADKTNPPPRDTIVFVGSSSIRLWKTLAQDFPESKVVNRGFGGSQIEDSTAFAERIILRYHPKAVVLYAGDNDIAAGKPPEEVAADFKGFVRKIHTAAKGVKITFISIKPSPARWQLVEKIRSANRMIEDYCKQEAELGYIDVFNPMLDAEAKPRADLFVADKLHMNPSGYALWRRIIKPRLEE
jgi:lysophospholipase L1-like esterase